MPRGCAFHTQHAMRKKILRIQSTIENKRAAGGFRLFRFRWVFRREATTRVAGAQGRARHWPMTTKMIHPATRIGHVHLKVADLERALGFYRDVLGFELTQRLGPSAAFLSAGGYHHHIGLNIWESAGGRPPAEGATGLYHLAILYPTRAELGDALRRLMKARIPLEGASDHGVSEA